MQESYFQENYLAHKQFVRKAVSVSHLNNFGKLKLRSSIQVYDNNPAPTLSRSNFSRLLQKTQFKTKQILWRKNIMLQMFQLNKF